MSVRKLPTGEWIADFYTVNRSNGKNGKRIRKKICHEREATAFENHTLQKVDAAPWLGKGKDNRRLSDLVNLWFDRHGITLNDGEKEEAPCYGLLNVWDHHLQQSLAPSFSQPIGQRDLMGTLPEPSE